MYRTLPQICALLVFFVGYFPIKAPLPGYAVPDHGLPTPQPAFDRLVFMLVDALRADFMFAQDTSFAFVNQTRGQGDAFSFVANAQIPTVTMPRIKVQ